MIPCEFMVLELLPTIRKETVNFLLSKNYSQRDISKIMNISEAAVSQYVKKRRGSHKKELEDMISKYIKRNYDLNKAFSENVCEMCTYLRKTRYFCKSHKMVANIPNVICRHCAIK